MVLIRRKTWTLQNLTTVILSNGNKCQACVTVKLLCTIYLALYHARYWTPQITIINTLLANYVYTYKGFTLTVILDTHRSRGRISRAVNKSVGIWKSIHKLTFCMKELEFLRKIKTQEWVRSSVSVDLNAVGTSLTTTQQLVLKTPTTLALIKHHVMWFVML